MSQVTQSPFLQALGYAIINSLWQFALLWLIYVSVNTFLKLSSHQKYVAGLLIQVAGFTWFAVTFSFYFQQFTKLEEIYFLQQKKFSLAFADGPTSTIGDKFFAGIMQTENFLPYLSIAYLLILFFLGAKWIRLYHITQTIKTKGLQKIDVNWRLFIKQLSNQLGIKREVKIFLSEMVQTPLTIGFFKPLILIPLASLNHLNTYQMEAIILHELAHIKRFDYLFNLFLALIDITLFFNPFTVLITKHIKRERENCCDDWVLQYEYNAASYASALLQIATCQSSSLLALQAADNKHVLLNRIKRMIEKKENSFFNYRYQLIALFVMLTVASSLALLSSLHNIKKAGVSPSSKQVTVEPMAERVSPLFKLDFFIAPDEEKGIKDNKFLTEKITNNNFHFDTLIASRISAVRDNKTSKQKPYPKLLAVEENAAVPPTPDDPVMPPAPDEPIAEDLVKNIETSNTGLEIPVAALEDQDVELEEQLKQLAIHLFEENKAAINQKVVLAEIKAAFAQIKKAKIQSELAKQKKPGRNQIRNNVPENELRINLRFAPCDMNKLQWITKELQLKTEEFRKQADRATERISRYNNNYYRAPKVIYRLPFSEKPHSFSFEFSTEPNVKVVTPHSFYIPKKVKKINKKSLDEADKNFKLEKTSPFIPKKSLENDTEKEDDFLIIRI